MGRSGCGKTSLLEILCGLRAPSAGRIHLYETEATLLPPHLRGIGYVPQDSALFPTYTVRENIGFAPRLQGCSPRETRARVDALADQLGIAHLLERLPAQLSGGERQRTALGRALAARPRILLLDEPLSALDEDLQADLRSLLRSIHDSHALTTLHVTHSRTEAGQLADLRLVLEAGGVHEWPGFTP
jgi:ABC-type sugar transport system ATPase subunit